ACGRCRFDGRLHDIIVRCRDFGCGRAFVRARDILRGLARFVRDLALAVLDRAGARCITMCTAATTTPTTAAAGTRFVAGIGYRLFGGARRNHEVFGVLSSGGCCIVGGHGFGARALPAGVTIASIGAACAVRSVRSLATFGTFAALGAFTAAA